jgi:hypothetical protein
VGRLPRVGVANLRDAGGAAADSDR